MTNVQGEKISRTLLYEELAERMARLIEQGTFRPGERIPSVRQTSKQQGVSISTVLQAYLLLEDRGLIEARPQSGYYVRAHLPTGLPEPEMSMPVLDPSNVNLHDLVMQLLRDTLNPRLVQLGAALPNLGLLPTEKINRLVTSLARSRVGEVYQYRFPPGLESLRVEIAKRAIISGCSLSPNDIVITAGGVEAINLGLLAVCRPADIVAVESPMYFGTLQCLEVLQLKALEIPTHPRDGISLDALAFAIEHNPVRAVIVISNFNNPLGSCIPDEKKKALVELLARYEIPLIENDVSGELYFTGKRPLTAKSFDERGLVMLVSSFSKDISPALRVGWIAPGRWRHAVEWLKVTLSVDTGTFAQQVVAGFLASGGYDHHLRRTRREYARNVSLMAQAVMRFFPPGTRVTRPTGGFVLWVQLPESIDSLELYRQALKVGITLAPGYVFSATNQYRNFIRLNAAVWSYQVERAIETLGGLIAEMGGRETGKS
jgi:DNA-binding transcriptional MocR family regulator